MRWTLNVNGETATGPLPASYFVENWETIVQAVGPFASVRLVSDRGIALTPVGNIRPGDLVDWWKVDPGQAGDPARPGLRAAFDYAEDLARGNASKASRLI